MPPSASPAPAPAPAPTLDATELISLKRKLAIIEAEHNMMKGQGPQTTITGHIHTGRILRRMVDLFVAPRELVMEADYRIERLEIDEDAEFTPEQNRRYNAYSELLRRIPLLKNLLEDGEGESIQTLYRNLRKGSDNARGDDTAKLKAAVVPWVNNMIGASAPPLRTDSKLERGLDNDNTGRLLCPGEFSWDDLSVRSKIREGHEDYMVTAQSWPNFLYAGYVCDINDVEKGLFKGPILVKAFKSIFTSPSSASDALPNVQDGQRPTKRAKTQTPTRSNVATIIGMDRVTPRAIAYVAVQLRFALSGGTSWSLCDIDFSNVEFYTVIVDFFEATPGPRAQAKVDELLAWWNLQIFGRRMGALAESQQAGCNINSSMARLAAQRQALENAQGNA